MTDKVQHKLAQLPLVDQEPEVHTLQQEVEADGAA